MKIEVEMTGESRLGLAFQMLVEATASVTGIDFFRVLVRELAQSLGFKYAFVSELTDQRLEKARIMAMWVGNRFGDNIGYELGGTPCESVARGEFCVFGDRICDLYPTDRVLFELEVAAYIGIPLRDAKGKPIGILSALHTEPVSETSELRAIFEVFASRAGVELERLRMQSTLAESEKRFRSYLESGNDLILAVDREGRIQYASPSCARVSGYEPEEVVGKVAFDFVPASDRATLLEMLRVAIDRPIPGPLFETKIQHKDGHWIDVESRANQTFFDKHTPGLVINCRDISERKKAEARLRFGKTLLETQSDCSPDGVLVISREGKVLHSNRRFAEIWNLDTPPNIDGSAEEIWRKVQAQLEESAQPPNLIQDLGEDAERTIRQMWRLRDGRSVECYSAPVRHSTGANFGRLWSCRDLTEQVRLQDQLRHSQRLECIGTVASGIAHEFRNYLGPILGNAELALLDTPQDHEVQKWLMQIIKSTQAARDLVQQILTFGRQAPSSRAVASVGDVVTDGMRMLRVAIPKSVEISRSITPGLPLVWMDANQIHQVIMNLGINAWQAMERGLGHISVSVDLAMVDEHLDPNLRPGRYVRLRISDNGKGMDVKTLDRLFEPFFTTKKVGEGTGLGLSMVHGIVKSHDGEIHVTSSPGHGTTFEIFLPPANDLNSHRN